ncbi:MAG: CvpA family protein, partial [Phycisphaerales bacterium]
MVFNIIVIGLVLGLAYAWMVRGFFNSFIHLLCVLAAGAVAFALWEPLAYLLVSISPERGLLSFIGSAAWGIGLVIPFAAFLLIFRVITDKVIASSIKNATVVDYVGGGACGVATGIICAGVMTIGVQSMRLPSNFFGYQPVWYTEDRASGGGSLVFADKLWVPVDHMTGWVYRGLSNGSMSSPEPLARWYPNIVATSMAARVSPGEGRGQNTINPDHVRIVTTYSIGSQTDAREAKELLTYRGSTTPQAYVDVDGNTVTQGYVTGYVLEFEPEAKEKGGKSSKGSQVIVSNGQVSLLTEDSDGNTKNVFPLAVISESADTGGELGRWRFDSRDVFISSVGGQSKVKMGFEFLIPQDETPLALIVRQSRIRLDDANNAIPTPAAMDDTADRDRRIRSGSIFEGAGNARRQRDTANAVRINPTTIDRSAGISVTNSLGEIVPSQTARSEVTLDDKNQIQTGEAKFSLEVLQRTGAGKNLRVDTFAIGSGQALVQIDVSLDKTISFLDEAARGAPTDQPIVLIDDKGGEYEAIGFTYKDRDLFHVRFTPGSTLSGINDTPAISSARDDQRLVLLFVVTRNVMIDQLAVG